MVINLSKGALVALFYREEGLLTQVEDVFRGPESKVFLCLDATALLDSFAPLEADLSQSGDGISYADRLTDNAENCFHCRGTMVFNQQFFQLHFVWI